MKKINTICFAVLSMLHLSTALHAATWFVHNFTDTVGEGSLRVQIQSACETPGNDIIKFMDPTMLGPITIRLGSPLVIPRDCQGTIRITGHESRETRIEMSGWGEGEEIPGAFCSFNIYSDGNTLDHLKMFGNGTGADVCLFGRSNKIFSNTFGHFDGRFFYSSRYGVVMSDALSSTDSGMDGSQSLVQDNIFLSDSIVAIYAHSSNNALLRNQINHTRQMGIIHIGHNSQVSQNTINDAEETGILVQGNQVVLDHNTIQGSVGRALVYEGNEGQITETTITTTGLEGLLYRGDNGQITTNTISNTQSDAVALEGDGLLFNNNTVTHSESNGVIGKINNSYINHNHISDIQKLGMSFAVMNLRMASNEVHQAHLDGVVLQGNGGDISDNFIHSNSGSGFVLSGHAFWLYKNRILSNGGCPTKQQHPAQTVACFDSSNGNGTGILIEAGSTDMVVGGSDFARDSNIIQYNHDGGVVIRGGAETIRNHITHNIISDNYGAEPDLDLLADGLTLNDIGDSDTGPNTLLNYADYVQAFPLVPAPSGEARYWSWGLARSGSEIELYRVSDEDVLRHRTHGGGHVFLGDSEISDRTFRIPPHINFNSFEDQLITLLSSDLDKNTSEFSQNIDAGRDLDMDGIIDSHEVREGSTTPGSRMDLTDTDGDGLPDSVEDRNRNGVWDRDLGETSAYESDTDHDGLNDWAETHGDGVYNPESFDTNPFNPDTDGDGLQDGAEDRNNNGVWDNELGESSPLYTDSDNDGVRDGRDNCPHIPNPAQEPWMCVRSSL